MRSEAIVTAATTMIMTPRPDHPRISNEAATAAAAAATTSTPKAPSARSARLTFAGFILAAVLAPAPAPAHAPAGHYRN